MFVAICSTTAAGDCHSTSGFVMHGYCFNSSWTSSLSYCHKDDADDNERRYIAEYNTLHPNGLNMTTGGKVILKYSDVLGKKTTILIVLMLFQTGYRLCEASLEKLRRPREERYPRKNEEDQGIEKYLHRYSCDGREGWTAYYDGLRRTFTCDKYTPAELQGFARHYLNTGEVHEDYKPFQDPNNKVHKSPFGYTGFHDGKKRCFFASKYTMEQKLTFAVHFRMTGEIHEDYTPDEKEVAGYYLPHHVLACYEDDEKTVLRGFEHWEPTFARKKFVDPAETLDEKYDQVMKWYEEFHSYPREELPDRFLAAPRLPKQEDLPQNIFMHFDNNKVHTGYRVRFPDRLKQYNCAFTKSGQTLQQKLQQALDHRANVLRQLAAEEALRDYSPPDEPLPPFIYNFVARPSKTPGYRVQFPGHPPKSFGDSKSTLREKFQKAKDYLASLRVSEGASSSST